MDEPLASRGEFPALENSLYLISHALGAMPREASEGLRDRAETRASRGVRAGQVGWEENSRTVGDRIERILGAPSGTVSVQPDVSTAQSIIASSFDLPGPRRKFVLCAEDLLGAPHLGWRQRRPGAEIVLVHLRDGHSVPLDGIVAAIDEQTALVSLSQFLPKTTTLLDLSVIVEKAHAVGATVLVDAHLGVGTVPLDVGRTPVDFVAGSLATWLCGGPRGAYLYVCPGIFPSLEPSVAGWPAHAHPPAFEGHPNGSAGDVSRMRLATGSLPAICATLAGPEIVASIGVEKIRAKSIRQTSRLVALAEERGWRVVSTHEPERRGGTVTIDIPNGAAMTAALAASHVLVDFWPGVGVRVSPHFYTKDEEIDGFVSSLAEVLEAKKWIPFVGRGAPTGPDSPHWSDPPERGFVR